MTRAPGTLIFESHATSTDNEKGIASGWLDPLLSAKGRKQAEELGQRYHNIPLSCVYVSDLRRSFETAEIAFGHRAIPVVKEARLREWNYGKYNGCPASEVDSMKIKHLNEPFPEGESLKDVLDRFSSFKKEYLQEGTGPILIIGHRATYYALEFYLQKKPLQTLILENWKWQPGWHYFLP